MLIAEVSADGVGHLRADVVLMFVSDMGLLLVDF